jgi:malate dehydrogenase
MEHHEHPSTHPEPPQHLSHRRAPASAAPRLEYPRVSTIAILGAGPIGASVAHRLAQRSRVRTVRLIDAGGTVASGKALDIRQSGPVERFDTIVEADTDVLASASASVIVVADEAAGGEWRDERGLAMVQQLVRAGITAPLVFAGPSQARLMEQAYRELKIPAHRLVGSAAGALAGAVRAVAGLEIGQSSIDVAVVGRPPSLVIGWAAASVDGTLLTDCVPAHRLLAIEQTLPKLWPPKPYAIASATAPIVEALIDGSRRRHHGTTILDGEHGARGSAVMLPLELGRGRVLSHPLPSLSPQERTEFLNAIG